GRLLGVRAAGHEGDREQPELAALVALAGAAQRAELPVLLGEAAQGLLYLVRAVVAGEVDLRHGISWVQNANANRAWLKLPALRRGLAAGRGSLHVAFSAGRRHAPTAGRRCQAG